MQSGTDEASFITTTEIASCSHGSTVGRPDSQRTQNENTLLQFLFGFNDSTAVDTAPIVNNRCLLPIEWLRYWIQLMFPSGNMRVVATTQ